MSKTSSFCQDNRIPTCAIQFQKRNTCLRVFEVIPCTPKQVYCYWKRASFKNNTFTESQKRFLSNSRPLKKNYISDHWGLPTIKKLRMLCNRYIDKAKTLMPTIHYPENGDCLGKAEVFLSSLPPPADSSVFKFQEYSRYTVYLERVFSFGVQSFEWLRFTS